MSTEVLEPAFSLFYSPKELKPTQSLGTAEAMDKVRTYLAAPPNQKQLDAIKGSFDLRLSMLWGPPGTGKTATLATLILAWMERAHALNTCLRICVGAANYNAIDNVLQSCAELLAARSSKHISMKEKVYRVRSDAATPRATPGVIDAPRSTVKSSLPTRLSSDSGLTLVGATHVQLLRLSETKGSSEVGAAWFDLLILDEASQIPCAAALSYMCLLRQDAHVVVCGDDKQLGPVYQYAVEDSRSGLLDCVFSYYRNFHAIAPVCLATNYRSNEVITGWPSQRFYGNEYVSHHLMRRLEVKINRQKPVDWPSNLCWSPDLLDVLDPDAPLTLLVYEDKTSTVANLFEAQISAAVIHQYASLLGKPGGLPPSDFWDERAGLVTPHRAQIATIRNLLGPTLAPDRDVASFIDTVDRFQGQERDLIVASYTVSDPDFIASEEEFILDPRRFNVTLTRARMKFVMLVSRTLLNHLPADEEIARGAAHLQLFPDNYCSPEKFVDLPYFDAMGKVQSRRCQIYIKKLQPPVRTSI